MSFRALLTELTRLPYPTSYNLITTYHELHTMYRYPCCLQTPPQARLYAVRRNLMGSYYDLAEAVRCAAV